MGTARHAFASGLSLILLLAMAAAVPSVQLTSPIDSHMTGPVSDFHFRYDSGGSTAPALCGLYVDSSGVQKIYYPSSDPYPVYRSDNGRGVEAVTQSDDYYLKGINLAGLAKGPHSYVLNCSAAQNGKLLQPGDAGYFEALDEGVFTLGDPAWVELVSPSSSHSTKDHSIDFTFVYHAGDIGGKSSACSLVTNGQRFGALQAPDGQPATLHVEKMQMGSYRWSILCGQTYSENRSLFIEKGAPASVRLVAPLTGYKGATVPPLKFTYSGGDDGPQASLCELGLDSSIVNQTTASSGVAASFAPDLAPGDHTWFVQCGRDTDFFAKSVFYTLTILPGGKKPASNSSTGGTPSPSSTAASGGANRAVPPSNPSAPNPSAPVVKTATLQAPAQVRLSDTISLRLVSDAGAPLANAQIRVYGPSGRVSLTTDADGRANFSAAQPGSYTYSVPEFVMLSNPATNVSAAAPSASADAKSAGDNLWMYALLAVLVLVVIGFVLLYMGQRKHPEPLMQSPTSIEERPMTGPMPLSREPANSAREPAVQMHEEASPAVPAPDASSASSEPTVPEPAASSSEPATSASEQASPNVEAAAQPSDSGPSASEPSPAPASDSTEASADPSAPSASSELAPSKPHGHLFAPMQHPHHMAQKDETPKSASSKRTKTSKKGRA
ncbi:Carboxypeptidase regulatory-like domain protein [uncultured archaeon]|nr:Carboxypeptidase regulatory-like domain protein [uncultured archaeon]